MKGSAEELQSKVEMELRAGEKRKSPVKVKESDIESIDCGEKLYEIFAQDVDPYLYR